jgi:hypothetical protein
MMGMRLRGKEGLGKEGYGHGNNGLRFVFVMISFSG